ncbi:MAG: 23S rRNA (pseudouridine(1915)-N(3))-methyltransferase RlmH [Alistipes sp.]|jgi:23S rRNA (pseudouridine1915-N3)-methyltransferase|nr:23S rRNA (pseudouridine(1915)-N(3))-methyltransferase RlmH [Alistipes sp.]
MTIDLITVGKTDSAEVSALVALYSKRIGRWARFGVVMLPDVKRTGKTTEASLTRAEGEMLLRQFAPDDHVVLLDDKGPQPTSMEFASWLGRRLAGVDGGFGASGGSGLGSGRVGDGSAARGSGRVGGSGVGSGCFGGAGGLGGFGGVRRLCFVVGGAYGFSPEVRKRANETVSLSRMTFSHQIVRAIFAEQLYRAFSILHGEPYHHE